MSGQGWANASMPRDVGEIRENQSWHWDDYCDAKRSTSTLQNKSQIWATVWRFKTHSPDRSFCLNRKWAARFKTPGTWTAVKERNLSWAQRRKRCACLCRVRDREPLGDLYGILPPSCPSWISHDTPWVRGESESVQGRWVSAPGSLCPRRPRPSLSGMRPSWPFGDGESHPFWLHSGEKWGPAEGHASWPLCRRASAKAGPKSSESDAAVNNTSSSLKKMALRASGLGHKY